MCLELRLVTSSLRDTTKWKGELHRPEMGKMKV